jgi:hypothetical protein
MDALEGLAPAVGAYARLAVADAFNWAELAAAIEPGEWYLVAFRSTIRPDADLERLHAHDDWAHAEASRAPGFVHYFRGPLADDGTCLSFCLWTTRAAAREAAGQTAHRNAVTLTGETYVEYTLEFLRLRKPHRGAAFEFTPYDLVDPGPARRRPTTLGLRPAAS